jgi:hypothetical protein
MIYKFRSLTDETDAQGNLLPDEDRFTRFSDILRRTSLDELPELFNVLKGEMSLVGPRPLLMQYLDRFDAVQARRHEVRPGITGWAQVNGRNAISWEKSSAGCLVCGSPQFLFGLKNSGCNPEPNIQTGRYQGERACHCPGIYGE